MTSQQDSSLPFCEYLAFTIVAPTTLTDHVGKGTGPLEPVASKQTSIPNNRMPVDPQNRTDSRAPSARPALAMAILAAIGMAMLLGNFLFNYLAFSGSGEFIGFCLFAIAGWMIAQPLVLSIWLALGDQSPLRR